MTQNYSESKESKRDNLAVGAKGGAIAFALKISSAGLNFVNQIILARILGASGVGEVLLAISVVRIFTQIGKFGMEEAMMRFIPVFIDQNDKERLKGIINFALRFCFVLSIFFVFFILVFSKFIAVNIFHSEVLAKLLAIIVVTIPATVIKDVTGGILKGHRDIFKALMPEFIVSPFFRIVIFLLLTIEGMSSLYAVVAYVVGEFIALLVAGKYLMDLLKELGPVKKKCEKKKILDFAYTIVFTGLSLWLYTEADKLIIGFFMTTREVGIYGIAAKLVIMLVNFPMFAFATIVQPLISSVHASANRDELKRIIRESSRWTLSMTMPIVLVLVFEGNLLLRYIFGLEFESGYPILLILTVAYMINTGSGLIGVILQMTGQHKIYMKVNLILGLLNLILNIILIPRFGILGAAISTLICIALLDIVCVYFIYVRLSVFSLARGVGFDVLFISAVSTLYYLISYSNYHIVGHHILLAAGLIVYLYKSIVSNDIPWRLLMARYKET